MAIFNQDDEFAPAFSYDGKAVHWSTLFVIIHGIFFILGAIMVGVNFTAPFYYSLDNGESFPQLWRLFTYPFLDSNYYRDAGFAFWFIIAAYILFHNGQSVERFLGRTIFLQLYLSMILIPGVIVGLIEHFVTGFELAGVLSLSMGMMIANATIYPDGETSLFPISYSLASKLFLGLNCALAFANHNYGDIIGMLTASVVAYFGMRFSGVGRGMDAIVDWRESRLQAKIEKKIEIQSARKMEAETTLDSVLEKISQKGLASLSSSEKAILQQASAELKKRDRK